MKVIIVDDEPLGRRSMQQLLADQKDIDVAGEAGDVDTALRLVERQNPEVIFLDIQLRGETGFDLLAKLPDPGPRVVFVTAFDTYAVRAFECNAIDYLLKPVDPERLAATLERLQQNQPAPVATNLAAADRLMIKSKSELHWVHVQDIECIRSDGNYTLLCRQDHEPLCVYRPLKSWLDVLPDSFMRIHRQTLVQVSLIRELTRGTSGTYQAQMRSGETLPVGRRYLPELKSRVVRQE